MLLARPCAQCFPGPPVQCAYGEPHNVHTDLAIEQGAEDCVSRQGRAGHGDDLLHAAPHQVIQLECTVRKVANQLRERSHVPPWCIRISPLNRARKVESTGSGEHAGGTSSSTQRLIRSLMGADCLALASAVAVHTARAFTMYGCASTTMRASWTGVSTCTHLFNCYEVVQITIRGE